MVELETELEPGACFQSRSKSKAQLPQVTKRSDSTVTATSLSERQVWKLTGELLGDKDLRVVFGTEKKELPTPPFFFIYIFRRKINNKLYYGLICNLSLDKYGKTIFISGTCLFIDPVGKCFNIKQSAPARAAGKVYALWFKQTSSPSPTSSRPLHLPLQASPWQHRSLCWCQDLWERR